MSTVLRARTGQVVPAPDPPGGGRVEQVGWGVARQVARVLREQLADPGAHEGFLALVVERAEAPGHLAYAVFLGRTAVALALVQVADPGAPGWAAYLGDLVLPVAPPGTRTDLLVRALHDAGAAGAAQLSVTCTDEGDEGPRRADLRVLGFG